MAEKNVSVYWYLWKSYFCQIWNQKRMNFKHCANDFGDRVHNRSVYKNLRIHSMTVNENFCCHLGDQNISFKLLWKLKCEEYNIGGC